MFTHKWEFLIYEIIDFFLNPVQRIPCVNIQKDVENPEAMAFPVFHIGMP
jgi:hypothetical protein